MERETGIEPATFSLARRCSTTEPLPLIRYVCETKIAYQGRFVNDLIVRQSEEPSHRDIFVNRFPMNAPALSNQSHCWRCSLVACCRRGNQLRGALISRPSERCTWRRSASK